MINLKYKDIPLTLDEDTGKFSSEECFESLDWLAMKRHIDAALKTKYTPVMAMYSAYRGGNEKPQVVTIVRPVIGSSCRAWITDADRKREAVNLDRLISMDCKDEYLALWEKADAIELDLREIRRQIATLKHADMPQPIIKP